MVLALLVAAAAFVALFIYQSLRIRDMQTQYQAAQADFQKLQDRNDKLKQHLDFYSGPAYMLYVEKVARESLGMAKPGETVVLPITDAGGTLQSSAVANTNSPSVSITTAQAPPHKSNWQNWLGFFFGS